MKKEERLPTCNHGSSSGPLWIRTIPPFLPSVHHIVFCLKHSTWTAADYVGTERKVEEVELELQGEYLIAKSFLEALETSETSCRGAEETHSCEFTEVR